jgi:tetratricopeptide (TPR) repeat protein
MTWKTLPHLRYLLHHDPDGNGSLQLFARAFESAGQVGNAILVHHLRLLFEGSKKSTVRTIASLLRSTQNLWLAAKYYRFLFQFSAVPETETVRFLEFYYEQHQQHGELDELYRILSQRTGKKEWRRRQIQLHSSHLKTNRSTELAESYLEDYPEDLEAWTMLGRMYRDREEQAKYLEVRKRIARRFPDEVDASWDSGFVLWDAGRKSEALRIFERTMKQVDVIPEKRLEVARLHADQGNYSRALDHMETLQENQNLPHSALPDLAYFARQANERDRGLRIIMNKKRSMDATGSSVEARTNVARALALVGRPRQALRIYKDLTREKPEDHELLLKIGRNLMAVEQFREARSYFLKVLAVRPEHEEALKRAGQASVWIEEHRAAVKYLERYLSVVPEDVQASYLLGEVHYAMGDSRKGFYRQRSTVSLFEANPPADATETMMFARASARIGHIDRSMSLYKTILENQELSEDLADSYMKTLLENRLYEKALHLLNTRFATFANRPNFRQFRARIYANTNRMRQARQILMEVERQQDREVGIWMDLGFINKQLGYWNESMYYLEQAIDASGDTLTDKPRTSLNQRRGILREKRPRAQFSFIHHLEGEDVRTGGTVSVQHPISEFMEVQLKQSYHHVHAQLPVGTSDQEVADIRVTGLNVTYAENENTTVTGGANVISSGETGGGLYGFMEHTFSSTETTLEFEAKYNQLWQEPVRPSALNGRRNGASLAVTQNLGKRMELYLEGEGAQVSIDGDDGLPGQGDGSGTEFQGTARMSYVTHKAPFLSFSLSHRHVNYSGDDSLFALLPLAERTNVTAVNVYHEHQWDRHWTGVLSGGAGTDFSRNVGLLYFGRCEVRARPISRFHGWAAYEHSSETATSDAGSSHRFELGLEVTF